MCVCVVPQGDRYLYSGFMYCFNIMFGTLAIFLEMLKCQIFYKIIGKLTRKQKDLHYIKPFLKKRFLKVQNNTG